MGRYTGPKTKVSRRYGVPLFGSSKSLERKNYPPGMHGPKGSRRKQSDYAIALGEKQKLRYQYGLLERQFRRIFQSALRKRGVTGETLLQLLETRLDNVVYRLGFANTRSGARQLVSHGHVLVNGKRVNLPSYLVKPGDAIQLREAAQNLLDRAGKDVDTADDEHVAADCGSGDHDLANFVSREQFKGRACLNDKHISIFAGEVDFAICCHRRGAECGATA